MTSPINMFYDVCLQSESTVPVRTVNGSQLIDDAMQFEKISTTKKADIDDEKKQIGRSMVKAPDCDCE